MACAEYYVSEEQSHWKIRFGADELRYVTRLAAMTAAMGAAAASGRRGFQAQVLVEGDDGDWKIKWIYDRDAEPGRT